MDVVIVWSSRFAAAWLVALAGRLAVFVQSTAFPDRLVALDGLTLPERVDSVGQLLELVSTITGQTTLGKLRDELDASVKEIGGDALASILADVSTHHGSVDIAMGGRTGGQLTVLISVEKSNFRFWVDNDGLHTQSTRAQIDASGSGIVYIEHSVNGSRVTMTHKEYWKGGHTGSVVYDANGNVIDESIVPLSDVPTTVAVTTATTVAATTSDTTPGDDDRSDDTCVHDRHHEEGRLRQPGRRLRPVADADTVGDRGSREVPHRRAHPCRCVVACCGRSRDRARVSGCGRGTPA